MYIYKKRCFRSFFVVVFLCVEINMGKEKKKRRRNDMYIKKRVYVCVLCVDLFFSLSLM